MPDWVVQKFRAGEVPSEVITMATTGIHFLFVKVEVVSMISSYQVRFLEQLITLTPLTSIIVVFI